FLVTGVQTCARPIFTLRDTAADMSLPVTVHPRILEAAATLLGEGAHIVVHAKPTFWPKRGTLQLEADQLRAVGVGELLARIEQRSEERRGGARVTCR